MNSLIEIKTTKKFGRGLFATKNIKRGDIIERSPVIDVAGNLITGTELNMYVFEWRHGRSAIALGLGSLFNHKNKYNVTYNPVFSEKEIIFVAHKNIKKGDQLFINYGYDPKYGIETTERNIFTRLKQKFEPTDKLKRFDSEMKAAKEVEKDLDECRESIKPRHEH